MRYRDMESIDLTVARAAVCEWLDRHPGGTLASMAEDLKRSYQEFPDEMAIVLRGMMAAELRRRTTAMPPPAAVAEPAATLR